MSDDHDRSLTSPEANRIADLVNMRLAIHQLVQSHNRLAAYHEALVGSDYVLQMALVDSHDDARDVQNTEGLRSTSIGWHPIETVPEGVWVLVHDQYEKIPCVAQFDGRHWYADSTFVDAEAGWESAIVNDVIDTQVLTHWHPLPPEPPVLYTAS